MTTETELRTLERRLAEREARVSIESYCEHSGGGWYDLEIRDPDCGGDVDEAVRYLELRGLLQRLQSVPNIARIRDESDHHDWKCLSPGEYDFLYECQRCGQRHVESIDKPGSDCPKAGCTGRKEK